MGRKSPKAHLIKQACRGRKERGPLAISGGPGEGGRSPELPGPFWYLGSQGPAVPSSLVLAAGASLWRARALLAPPHLRSLGGPSGHCPWALGAAGPGARVAESCLHLWSQSGFPWFPLSRGCARLAVGTLSPRMCQ